MTTHAEGRVILVTGAAGFIGFHVARRLLERGELVLGVDNLNNYYDVRLKEARLAQLQPYPNFRFEPLDVGDRTSMERLFADNAVRQVVHMAAQAGVRYSLINPHAYIESNINGFLNMLEGCRAANVEHLVYASSSSVYGGNAAYPFSVSDNVDHPLSLYAASKKSNELMAHTYSHLFRLPTSALRLFTVYGPWGRPDMAPFLFTKAILEGQPIDVFNHGQMWRDFTYVDDIVEGVLRVLANVPQPNPQYDTTVMDPRTSWAPYRVYNIGNNQPIALLDFIAAIEQALGQKAEKRFLPMQPGDVVATCADIADLTDAVGFTPTTAIDEGISRFVKWYREYYRV